jgi:hypothetical protein
MPLWFLAMVGLVLIGTGAYLWRRGLTTVPAAGGRPERSTLSVTPGADRPVSLDLVAAPGGLLSRPIERPTVRGRSRVPGAWAGRAVPCDRAALTRARAWIAGLARAAGLHGPNADGRGISAGRPAVATIESPGETVGDRRVPDLKPTARATAVSLATSGRLALLSLDVARSRRREDAELGRVRRRLRAELTAEQWRMCVVLSDADRAARLGEQDRLLEELRRHFPGFASAFRTVADRTFEGAVTVGAGPCASDLDVRRGHRDGASADLLRRRLRAELTAEQWRMCGVLSDADRAARLSEQDRLVDELCRRFPGFAPAIRVVFAHIIDTPFAEEACCEGARLEARDSS